MRTHLFCVAIENVSISVYNIVMGKFVSGYAFTKDGSRIRVLNLNKASRATIISNTGEVLETS